MVDWTADFTGTFGVGIHYYLCGTWIGGTPGSAVLRYKQNSTVNNTTPTGDLCMGTTRTVSSTTAGGGSPTVVWSVINGTGSGSILGTTFTPTSPGTVYPEELKLACVNQIESSPSIHFLQYRQV